MTEPLYVPIHLDAMVCLDPQNPAHPFDWFEMKYGAINQYSDPMPAAFSGSLTPPSAGVYLHWALPDALTHGNADGDTTIDFAAVPDRWLIARTRAIGGNWEAKFWVIESSYLDPTSPVASSSMFVDPTSTTHLKTSHLGRSHTIEEWVATPAGAGTFSLQAVAPGNVAFAAYMPFCKNVFSFIDTDALNDNSRPYTYLVAGWYSAPQRDDPLRLLSTFVASTPWGALWPDQATWQAQSAADRFTALCATLRWSVPGGALAALPDHVLCHGMLYGVDLASSQAGQPGYLAAQRADDPVQVVVANTAADALARLVSGEAQRQALSGAAPDPQWQTIAAKIEDLFRAMQYELLDKLDDADGTVQLEQQIWDHWFGSEPGGVQWELVNPAPQTAGAEPATNALPPAVVQLLDAQLAQLNQAQRAYNEQRRLLARRQAELFHLWWRHQKNTQAFPRVTIKPISDPISDALALSNPGSYAHQVWALAFTLQQAAKDLPPAPAAGTPSAAAAAALQAWAETYFQQASGNPSLAQLGLILKANTTPRFFHPNDPVVMLSGMGRAHRHGEDGRYNDDQTLTCRVRTQLITGITLSAGNTVTAAQASALTLTPLNAYTLPAYPQFPAVAELLAEAFWTDPGNDGLLGQFTPVIGAPITEARSNWVPPAASDDRGAPAAAVVYPQFSGYVATPFATVQWQQAWTPLFLEWAVTYYPTTGQPGQTDLCAGWAPGDPAENGSIEYAWQGAAGGGLLDTVKAVSIKGRSLLTPQSIYTFSSQLSKYLTAHPELAPADMAILQTTITNWDVLSQRLEGLTDFLATLVDQATLAPNDGAPVVIPDPAGGTPPTIQQLIGTEFHTLPFINADFHPVRAGFFEFDQLQVVDTFGQAYVIKGPAADTIPWKTQNKPLAGQGMAVPQAVLDNLTTQDLTGTDPAGADKLRALQPFFQLPPRVIQPLRLNFRLLANDDSGQDITIAKTPHAICGWLVPNHLDQSLMVYDAAGQFQIELQSAQYDLRTPDELNTAIAQITNQALRAVVQSFAGQEKSDFADLLQTLDETLWLIDPLGGRKDQMQSVMMGRPLAVVQAALQLVLNGQPYWDQPHWDYPTATQTTPPTNNGGITGLSVKVRLGNPLLTSEGLLGYFAGQDFTHFYSAHVPVELQDHTYIQPITPATYLSLTVDDPSAQPPRAPTTVTMIVDPRGSVHAITGILPVKRVALPPYAVETFLRNLQMRFRAGPLMALAGSLPLPPPAEKGRAWVFTQGATPIPTVDARKLLLFPHGDPVLSEGILTLQEASPSDTSVS